MQFIPTDYQEKTPGKYSRIQDGENKFRILSEGIVGFEYWVSPNGDILEATSRRQKGDKPVRVKTFQETFNAGADIHSRPFSAFKVWNYQTEQIEVLQIGKITINRRLEELTKDADWADISSYDIVIKRIKGATPQDTRYEVSPKLPKPLDAKIKQVAASEAVDLSELFRGGNPFSKEEAQPTVDADKINSDIPF